MKYIKIVEDHNQGHFGAKTVVYRGEAHYFIIIEDRDGRNYYFADLELAHLYPAGSYLRSTRFVYDSENSDEWDFQFNFSGYGYSPFPEWLKALIGRNSR